MSWRAIIVFAGVALVLGVAWLVGVQWLSVGGPARDSGPLLDFRRGEVTAVGLTLPRGSDRDEPGPTLRFVRDEQGGWQEVISDGSFWPISPGHLNRLLIALEGSEVMPEPGPGPSNPFAIELSLADGTERRAEMSSSAVAGRVILRAPDGATASLISDLARQLSISPPPSWRVKTALPQVRAEAVRGVSLHRSGGAAHPLAFGESLGRWSLHEPCNAPAETSAVMELVRALIAVRTDDVLSGDAHPGDLGSWVWRCSFEPSSVTLSVFAKGPADRPEHRYATNSAVPGAVLVVPGSVLSTLETDPVRYVRRGALGVPAADVGRIEIATADDRRSLRLNRHLSGWRASPDAPGEDGPDRWSLPEGIEAASIAGALLELMTEVEASPELGPLPRHGQETWMPEGRSLLGLELFDLANEPLATLTLLRSAEGRLVFADTQAAWVIPEDATLPEEFEVFLEAASAPAQDSESR